MAAPLAAAGPASWLFDAWSLVYDLPLIQRFTYRPVHAAVLRVLGRHEPLRRVLDVGCGTGLLSDQIAREHPATRVVGCDFSLGMLRRAAAARDGGAVWVRGDALRLPFRDTTFDALVCTEALHWFPDQGAALGEFHRVLRPGGHLLVALVNPPFRALGQIAWLVSRAAGQPFYWPTRRRMHAQVTAAGFHVERQRRLHRLPAGLAFPPVLTQATRPAGFRPAEGTR